MNNNNTIEYGSIMWIMFDEAYLNGTLTQNQYDRALVMGWRPPRPRPERKRKDLSGSGLTNNDIYCLTCKVKTKNKNLKSIKAKNGRDMLQSNCAECNRKKVQFV